MASAIWQRRGEIVIFLVVFFQYRNAGREETYLQLVGMCVRVCADVQWLQSVGSSGNSVSAVVHHVMGESRDVRELLHTLDAIHLIHLRNIDSTRKVFGERLWKVLIDETRCLGYL